MNEVHATNTLLKSIYDLRSMQETIESTNPVIPQSLTYTAPAISYITIPQATPTITALSTSAPVITSPLTINGVTIYANVSVGFSADAAGAVTTTPVSLVISYNTYYFNYTLPTIVCTIAKLIMLLYQL